MNRNLTKYVFIGVLLLPVAAHGDAFDHLAQQLDLTEGQRAAIDAERYKAQKEAIGLKAAVAESRLELQQLVRDPGASKSDIDRRIDELAAARAELQKSQVHSKRSMTALLTEEQRIKLDALKLERRERRGDRRGWNRQGNARRLNTRAMRPRARVRVDVSQPAPSW